MNIERAMVPEPLGQGDLDGLRGLYSVINGLRLLLARRGQPLGYSQCCGLFRTGIEFLDAHGRLAHGAHWGMSLSLWRLLTDRLCSQVNRRLDGTIEADRPFAPRQRVQRSTAFKAIEDGLDAGWPVLILLRGAYDHYTVVSAATPTRLRLFDSYGYGWVSRASCSVGASAAAHRHNIAAASITVLRISDQR